MYRPDVSLRKWVFTCLMFPAILAGARASLIHHWQFNELSGTTLTDSVGGMHAQVVELAGGGGYVLDGTSIRLDGGARAAADYIQFPQDLFDGLTDVTIEIWATPHSFQTWSRVIDMGPGENPAADNMRLTFAVNNDGNTQWLGLRPLPVVVSTLPTPADQMYHYVIVWSATGGPGGGGRLAWYRDGAFVGEQDTGPSSIATIANLPQTVIWLGRSPFAADATANASYHAMRIYDTALDAGEIVLLTLQGPDGTGPSGVEGLLHRWSFSETSGTTLADEIGGADGNIVVLDTADHSLAGGQVSLGGGARATADYLQFPSGLLNGLTSLSVEIWATPRAAQNWARLFDFGTGLDDPSGTFFLSLSRGADANLQRLEVGSPPLATLDTALATALNQQYHYVVTWEADGGGPGVARLRWYREGVLVGTLDNATITVDSVNDTVLWLGRSHYAGDATASADFNELRLYNRALTPAEINFNRVNGPDNFNLEPPVAIDDAVTLNPSGTVLIPVLKNDQGTGIVPGSVAIVSPPPFGTATVQPDGKIFYTQNVGSTTLDQFTYTVQNSLGKTSNVATVSLTISSALRLENTTMTIPMTPPPVGYALVDAFPGNLFFEDAVAIRSLPGRPQQLFVCERRGIISYIPDITSPTPTRQVFLDIRNQVTFDATTQGEMGLLSMAFHPGFETNGHFFVFYMGPSPRTDRVARFTADPVNLTVNTNTQQILFSVVDEVFNHNGGDMHFGPQDGYLYISMGDEGDWYNARLNAQRIDKDFYAGMLRIDVDKRPGNLEPTRHTAIPTNGLGQAFYSIPADNPFVGATSFFGAPINTNALRAEFYAVGLRHPWRFSIDSNGEIWVGDVGQNLYEEVDVLVPGGNYGWAYYEGLHLGAPLYPNEPTMQTNPPGGLQDPLWEYPHTAVPGGDPQYKGNSVTGGLVYHGSRMPELTGAYIFGDYELGHVWALRRTNGTVTLQRLTGESGIGLAAFGVDPSNGDVLIAQYFQNKIKRLVRTDAVNSTFPTKLSDTGIFAGPAALQPNPGIVNYEPIVAFWSDYALKRRWFVIPDLTNTIDFAPDDNWTFPTGTKWIKHFDLETQRGNPLSAKKLETRVLVKTDAGTFGVSYKWNDDGTEAFLVGDGGTNFNVTVQDGTNVFEQSWEIPSRGACLICHTPVGGHALSFNTRELNRSAQMNGINGNQITSLSQAGYFSAPVANVHTLPAFAHANDSNASLEYRVRSYLSVNCVQCHQPGGAGSSSWDARASITLAETMLINGTLIDVGSDPLNRLIVPGDTNHSVVLKRIKGDGFGRMPPLATHQLDQGAIALLTAWIAGDTNRRSFAEWQISHFGGTNAPNAGPAANPDGDSSNNYVEYLAGTDPQNSGDVWKLNINAGGGLVNVSYPRVANLGVVIDTSADLETWVPWNVPGNQPLFTPGGGMALLQGPLSDAQYFRARFIEP